MFKSGKATLVSTQEVLRLEQALFKLDSLQSSFDYVKITVASPKRMKQWAQKYVPGGHIIGEVKTAETINFRSHEPEFLGLFCERIFGPIRDWSCRCRKYQGFAIDKICEECFVELTEARVRRYRMGYIELAVPVAHFWYFKGSPNYLGLFLRTFSKKISLTHIENIIYYRQVEYNMEPKDPLRSFFYPLSSFKNHKNALSSFFLEKECDFKKISEKKLGAEVIQAALEMLDLHKEIEIGRNILSGIQDRNLGRPPVLEKALIRRVRIFESFIKTETNPAWLILNIIPVLPPNLRPLVELENGRLVAADLNEMYRLILNRNIRLNQGQIDHPAMIETHSRKLLQESVDALIDNARLPKQKIFSLNNKPLKSLTEALEGKAGRFRHSLLGKRVDYSARSVIVVGPTLRLNQCGLPYEIIAELFQPFLINELLLQPWLSPLANTKAAGLLIKKKKPILWPIIQNVLRKYSILLNRASTLHRFGIQAFDPIFVIGKSIHLHPLACNGFNADFDGDQMAVHLPISSMTQLEAKALMRPSENILSPANGEVMIKPSQDVVIGCYYLSITKSNLIEFPRKIFSNEKEALFAFYQKQISIHDRILVRYSLLDLNVIVENEKLYLIDPNFSEDFFTEEIKIQTIFPTTYLDKKKYFVLTNIGFFLIKEEIQGELKLTDIFIDTTPGKLLFSVNFKNLVTRFSTYFSESPFYDINKYLNKKNS